VEYEDVLRDSTGITSNDVIVKRHVTATNIVLVVAKDKANTIS
jgi:hypothetical protein